jgi:hypothetical protein
MNVNCHLPELLYNYGGKNYENLGRSIFIKTKKNY